MIPAFLAWAYHRAAVVGLPANETLALMTLAAHAQPVGPHEWRCDVTLADLAGDMRCARSTATTAVAGLLRRGVVDREKLRGHALLIRGVLPYTYPDGVDPPTRPESGLVPTRPKSGLVGPTRPKSGLVEKGRQDRNPVYLTSRENPEVLYLEPSEVPPTNPPVDLPWGMTHSDLPSGDRAESGLQSSEDDLKRLLWEESRATLMALDGHISDRASRALIGKWLRTAGGDVMTVVSAIHDAARACTGSPVAYVTRILAPKVGRQTPHQAVREALGPGALSPLEELTREMMDDETPLLTAPTETPNGNPRPDPRNRRVPQRSFPLLRAFGGSGN